MFRQNYSARRRMLTAAAVLCTCVFQFGFLPSCEGLLTTFNPGDTILGSVSAFEVDRLFADTPDWELDPSCTVPGFGYIEGNTAGGSGGICAPVPLFP
ncbi:MAG: hypothetical protein GY842_18700 [bacterium]|nr:hypothetical protein [bacterium]